MGLKRKTSHESTADCETPWKKLSFDDVEDKYLYIEPSVPLQPVKSVHFSSHQEVVEIPSRYDYFCAGIQLWWTKHEMSVFYRDSISGEFTHSPLEFVKND
jgi:hypothetical protein